MAVAVTGLAALVDPAASRFYWTRALWDTSRVGRLDYVSNQSLQGVLARLGETGRPLWALAVLGTLCVWAWRGRRAALAGDRTAAFALTGAAACLVSPITWVHHLVWLLPSFAVLLRAGPRRLAGALYAVLCTSVVWLWFDDASGLDGFLGSGPTAADVVNTYEERALELVLARYGEERFARRIARAHGRGHVEAVDGGDHHGGDAVDIVQEVLGLSSRDDFGGGRQFQIHRHGSLTLQTCRLQVAPAGYRSTG